MSRRVRRLLAGMGAILLAVAAAVTTAAHTTETAGPSSVRPTAFSRHGSSSQPRIVPEVQVLYSPRSDIGRQRLAAALAQVRPDGVAHGRTDVRRALRPAIREPSASATGSSTTGGLIGNDTAVLTQPSSEVHHSLLTWVLVPILALSLPIIGVLVCAITRSLRRQQRLKAMDGVELTSPEVPLRHKAVTPSPSPPPMAVAVSSPLIYVTDEVDRVTRGYGFSEHGDGRTGSIAESQWYSNPLRDSDAPMAI